MDLDEAYKNKIGERLTLRLAQALENKEVTLEESSTIASYVLENIDKAKNNLELVDFLTSLSQKWPIFAGTLEIERGEIKDKEEDIVAGKASQLIQENKIDEAIKIVESVTNTNQGGQS